MGCDGSGNAGWVVALQKIKRSERIGVILHMLSQSPNKLFTLSYLAQQFGCAKSTLSEDMTAVRRVLESYHLGTLETVAGAAGGVCYLPFCSPVENLRTVESVCAQLCDRARIMPGGFLYTVDLFSHPETVRKLGGIIAQQYVKEQPDVVVTVESKGVPIGLMTAQALGRPLVIARKENRATEGSVVTLNYLTTSSKRLMTMSLPRRALAQGKRALIVDDFVKGGGTVGALYEMIKEFSCEVIGVSALIGGPHPAFRLGMEIRSLMLLEGVDVENQCVHLMPSVWMMREAEQFAIDQAGQ